MGHKKLVFDKIETSTIGEINNSGDINSITINGNIKNILFRWASKNLNIISDNNITLFVNNKEMKLNNSENKPSIFPKIYLKIH